MILPDVNLLLYAHNTAARQHGAARKWWEDLLSGDELVGMAWLVVLGFIRITTGRAAFATPWAPEEALDRVDSWLAQPNVRILEPSHRHAVLLGRFIREAGTAGNLTNDAHLAALAVEHGYTVHTTDTDFARFPGLDWRNPLI